jgi:hypothetical protein
MHLIRATTTITTVLLISACSGSGADQARAEPATDTSRATAQGADPTHALFGCLIGDSAVYSNIARDTATDSVAGIEISLWHAGDGIDGATTDAPAKLERSVPIARVRLTGRDSVLLDMPHVNALDTSTFAGRVTCDSLWGRQQTSRSSLARDASYRRVP